MAKNQFADLLVSFLGKMNFSGLLPAPLLALKGMFSVTGSVASRHNFRVKTKNDAHELSVAEQCKSAVN
jgi:hypothetical protein